MRKRTAAPAAPGPADIEQMTLAVVDLLDQREQDRSAERSSALRGGPCEWCGMAETRADRGWSRHSAGLICGRCHDWLADCDSDRRRDLCASVLMGISTTHRRSAPRGLADDLGLILWRDLQIDDANESPWCHLDIGAMRDRLAEIAPGHYVLPARWHRDMKVMW